MSQLAVSGAIAMAISFWAASLALMPNSFPSSVATTSTFVAKNGLSFILFTLDSSTVPRVGRRGIVSNGGPATRAPVVG
jgi:hypothetical protein